jgi:hypothetical protein
MPSLIGPIAKIASLQSPEGVKMLITGMIRLSTNDFTKDVDATP